MTEPTANPFRAWLEKTPTATVVARLAERGRPISYVTVRNWRGGSSVALPFHEDVKAVALLDGITLSSADLFPAATLEAVAVVSAERRCASCRWATARLLTESVVRDEFTLRCKLLGRDAGAGACADTNPEYGIAPSIFVAPDFGCVQWEGKPGPVQGPPIRATVDGPIVGRAADLLIADDLEREG